MALWELLFGAWVLRCKEHRRGGIDDPVNRFGKVDRIDAEFGGLA